MAGEGEQALTYARQALLAAEQGDDLRARCIALSDMGLALESAGQLTEAERTRREQFTACSQAVDPVLVAQAMLCLGTSLLDQGYLLASLGRFSKGRRTCSKATQSAE